MDIVALGLGRYHKTNGLSSVVKCPVRPHTVISTSVPCCTLHEWPVFLPRSGVEIYAVAAISALRAHAAQKPNQRSGLFRHLRCDGHEWLVQGTAVRCAAHELVRCGLSGHWLAQQMLPEKPFALAA